MKHTTLAALMILPLLGGCGSLLETSYQRPALNLPDQWSSQTNAAQVQDKWWEAFHNPALNIWVEKVLANNNDLAVAAFKLRKAQLKADLAQDQFLPDLGASGSMSDSRQLRGEKTITRNYQSTASIGYEVDLWGKLARQMDSAAWEAAASQQDLDSTRISLIATTIKLYYKIGYLNERIALSAASIAYAQKTLDLTQVQHQAGQSSRVEEMTATQNLATQKAAHQTYLQNKVEALNAFAILLNDAPEANQVDVAHLPTTALPDVPAGVPAQILEQRPDIRAAEMRLRESLTDVDATRASYLPTFSLTGSLGSSSITLSNVMQNPIGTLGAGIALPFLNYFDMKKNVEISETDYEQAIATFRQTLYTALADVENALSARTHHIAQGEQLDLALQTAKESEGIYEVQYKAGYIPLQTWLDAQEKRRTAEGNWQDNRYNQLTDRVTLYESLGGGL